MGGKSVVTHIGTGYLHNRNWTVIEMRRARGPYATAVWLSYKIISRAE